MRKSVLTLSIWLGFMFMGSAALAQINPATVRIRLFKGLTEFPTINKAKIKRVSETMWRLQGDNLVLQNKILPSENLIVKKLDGNYDVISVVDFNTYIAGVITGEMPLEWPMEALKAQAVVARSFALARMKERKHKVFHLESNQADQVFTMPESNRALQATLETENTVLKDRNGFILKAFYHADCGGQTIPASQVWEKAVDSGVARDPWCGQRKLNQWSFTISKDEFFAKLNQDILNPTTALFFFKDRIKSIQVGTGDFTVQKLRETFGFSAIKNSPEKISFDKENIVISGRGYGHGAGLCQHGASEQAKRGVSYVQILGHYYPKAQISQNEIRLTQLLTSDFVSN
ncbi:MAG: SpoIID/LytB domain-containing protein [Bdellovibrionaceae bacterium]|nr:SpoIID/LytB domain-containing protein [Bdellovibrio sp.]